jgi:hypothetical protein
MLESKIIILPRTMSLVKRISEVSTQIRGWLKSVDQPLDDVKGKLQLRKCERNNREYCYHYSIIRRKQLTAFGVNDRITDTSPDDLSDTSLIPATYSQIEGLETDF